MKELKAKYKSVFRNKLKWYKKDQKNPLLRCIEDDFDTVIDDIFEELNNRSCGSCKYWDYKDNTTTIETCNFGLIDHSYNASSFYCNRYEAKGE